MVEKDECLLGQLVPPPNSGAYPIEFGLNLVNLRSVERAPVLVTEFDGCRNLGVGGDENEWSRAVLRCPSVCVWWLLWVGSWNHGLFDVFLGERAETPNDPKPAARSG